MSRENDSVISLIVLLTIVAAVVGVAWMGWRFYGQDELDEGALSCPDASQARAMPLPVVQSTSNKVQAAPAPWDEEDLETAEEGIAYTPAGYDSDLGKIFRSQEFMKK